MTVYLDSDFTGGLGLSGMSIFGIPSWPLNSASWARLIASLRRSITLEPDADFLDWAATARQFDAID